MTIQPTSGAASGRRTDSGGVSLQEFNGADEATAAELLRACLDIAAWVDEVSAGRPYATVDGLAAAGTRASARITWDQAAGALDRHPRIGAQPAGTGDRGAQDRAAAVTSKEAAWSADEQAGVHAEQSESLTRGNQAYEQRFGHIFLICATGLSGDQILAALTARLGNDPDTERAVVMDELRKIGALRLAKAVRP